MSTKKRLALVTGGARGIGKKICQSLLDKGCRVCFIDLDSEEGEKTLKELRSDYGDDKVYFFKGDITDEQEIKTLVKDIIEDFEKIDILINNAGITRDNLIMRMSIDDWEKVLKVNLTGAFICSKIVTRYMFKQKFGKIVNISSIVGVHGNAGQCNYSASKAGLIGLTKSLAREVASRNINVNAVAPGYIETDMTDKLNDEVKQKLLNTIPSGKLGSVEDVAKAVVFLSSEESDYITGTVLGVDGGMGI